MEIINTIWKLLGCGGHSPGQKAKKVNSIPRCWQDADRGIFYFGTWMDETKENVIYSERMIVQQDLEHLVPSSSLKGTQNESESAPSFCSEQSPSRPVSSKSATSEDEELTEESPESSDVVIGKRETATRKRPMIQAEDSETDSKEQSTFSQRSQAERRKQLKRFQWLQNDRQKEAKIIDRRNSRKEKTSLQHFLREEF